MIPKLPLPGTGKLNVRHRQMRGVWQCFAGNLYITGASGDFPQEAIQELFEQYEIQPGSTAVVHYAKARHKITIPEPSPE